MSAVDRTPSAPTRPRRGAALVVPQLRAWTGQAVPVVTGPQGHDIWTLADLADEHRSAIVSDRFVMGGTPPKASALMALHWGVWAVLDLLVAPLPFDGIEIEARPDQVGVVTDTDLTVVALWIGDVGVAVGGPSVRRVGHRVRELVDPVLERARAHGRISRRNGELLTMDAITGAVRRMERCCTSPLVEGWADGVLSGARHRSAAAPAQRTLVVHPDDGAAVRMPAPRLCCVLSSAVSESSCPTCPLRGDEQVLADATTEWLRSLDPAAFAGVAGRDRVGVAR